jgi:hypothetical protein
MRGGNIRAAQVTPRTRTCILAVAVIAGLMATTGSSFASTTLTLPAPGPPTGSSCSGTQVYVNPVPLPPSPILRGLPIPLGWIPDNLYGNGQTPLGDNCGGVSTGSSAKGLAASASTTFEDGGKTAMSNTATGSDSPALEEAHTEGGQQQLGTIPSPLTPQSETLSVTYTYEVLAESHQNADAAALQSLATFTNYNSTSGNDHCEGLNYPQYTTTGDPASHAVGAHTVTVALTCPPGHPLQADPLFQFGLRESNHLAVTGGTAPNGGTASSYISARWVGGTVTVGP